MNDYNPDADQELRDQIRHAITRERVEDTTDEMFEVLQAEAIASGHQARRDYVLSDHFTENVDACYQDCLDAETEVLQAERDEANTPTKENDQ